MSFKFDGLEVGTYGEIGSICCEIARKGDRERAARFVDAYVADVATRHGLEEARQIVASNIGYLSGYYSPDMMKAIQDVFDTSHPVFGCRTNVGHEEAFDAGAMMALSIDPQASVPTNGEDA